MTHDEQEPAQFADEEYRKQAEFRRNLRTFLARAEQEAREAGITPQQYLLLLIVRGSCDYPEVTIGTIAEDLKLAQPTASLLVDRAVKRRLLHRVEDASDRRRTLVSLTDAGQRVLDRIMGTNREYLATIGSPNSPRWPLPPGRADP
jgi:DNA-binding MarR family transcriptional regulator